MGIFPPNKIKNKQNNSINCPQAAPKTTTVQSMIVTTVARAAISGSHFISVTLSVALSGTLSTLNFSH